MREFEPWGIFFTLVGVVVALVTIVVDLEDRQAERTFRAWQVVLADRPAGSASATTGKRSFGFQRGDASLIRTTADPAGVVQTLCEPITLVNGYRFAQGLADASRAVVTMDPKARDRRIRGLGPEPVGGVPPVSVTGARPTPVLTADFEAKASPRYRTLNASSSAGGASCVGDVQSRPNPRGCQHRPARRRRRICERSPVASGEDGGEARSPERSRLAPAPIARGP